MIETYCDRCFKRIETTNGLCPCPTTVKIPDENFDFKAVSGNIVINISKIDKLKISSWLHPETIGRKVNELVDGFNQILDHINSKILT